MSQDPARLPTHNASRGKAHGKAEVPSITEAKRRERSETLSRLRHTYE